MTKQKNMNSIDIAKFIMSLCVISLHLPDTWKIQTKFSQFMTFLIRDYFAKLAVPFFFIAAGFFLWQKIDKEKEEKNKKDAIKKYTSKLAFLYLLWMIIYLPIFVNKIMILIENHNLDLYIIIRNLIFGIPFSLWFLIGLIVAVWSIYYLEKWIRRTKTKNKQDTIKLIFLIGSCFYILGVLTQSWFGLIKPLEILTPHFWQLLQKIQYLFGPARNGICEGIVFVSLGIIISRENQEKNIKNITYKFILCMFLFLLEIIFTSYFHLARATSMYISLIGCSYFFFKLIIFVNLSDNSIYPKLRKMSFLIFCIHTPMIELVCYFMKIYNLSVIFIPFYVVVISILISYLFLYLSQTKKFSFLQVFY